MPHTDTRQGVSPTGGALLFLGPMTAAPRGRLAPLPPACSGTEQHMLSH